MTIRHECPSLAWRGLGPGPKRTQEHHIDLTATCSREETQVCLTRAGRTAQNRERASKNTPRNGKAPQRTSYHKKKKNTREARGRKIQTRQTVEWRFGTLPHRNHKKIKKKKNPECTREATWKTVEGGFGAPHTQKDSGRSTLVRDWCPQQLDPAIAPG